MNLKAVAKSVDITRSAVKKRRRGTALEGELLEAAWAELLNGGYSAFTIRGVALRAQTSRHIITRRWPSRGALALAAFKHHIDSKPLHIPKPSDIRTELISYIGALYERDFPMVLMMWTQMDEYYREENSSPATFRETLLAGQTSAVSFLLERAAARGEVDRSKLTQMVLAIPGAFLAYFTATHARAEIRAAAKAMIDSVLLPLVASSTKGPVVRAGE